jgi:arylsulfatase A-like enzyme
MMAGCTTYVDTQLGRVIASARARAAKSGRPLWILFCSDHGDHFGAHRLRNKGPSGYEENIGVPLIVWASDRPGGIVQPSVVNLLDVLPTLHELVGTRGELQFPPPSEFRASSQRKIFRFPLRKPLS